MSLSEISQEERDLWRFEASDKCGTPSEVDERILRLLATLEACEADLERSCEETRANFSAVYQVCTEIIPDLKAKLEAAEAQNSRMNKMVDWLAGPSYCPPKGFTDCAVDCAECRKNYARRAVAEKKDVI